MTAREEFNRMLNEFEHPRAVYGALMGLASAVAEQKPDDPRKALLEALMEEMMKGESK